MDIKAFNAERVFREAKIALNGRIEQVFPLFSALEEKKWADGWNPIVVYPQSENIQEGMVFTTSGHGHGEPSFAWIVSKYQPENHLIEYIVSTSNRYWVIAIQCFALSENQTKATIRYTYTGLTLLGNEINKHELDKMYERNLQDWEEEINWYLQTGQVLKQT